MKEINFKRKNFDVLYNNLLFKFDNELLSFRIKNFKRKVNNYSVINDMYLDDSRFELYNEFVSNFYDEGFFIDTFNEEDFIDFREDFRDCFLREDYETFLGTLLLEFNFSKYHSSKNKFFKENINEKITVNTYANYLNLIFLLIDYCKQNGLQIYNDTSKEVSDSEIALGILGVFNDTYSSEAMITFLDLLVFLLFNSFLISLED